MRVTSLLLLLSLFITSLVHSLEDGDIVCAEGYIMDQYCITLGTLLDNRDVVTLERPDVHSIHCLVDVPVCRDSGYVVLKDKEEGASLHTIEYALDGAGTMQMIELARSVGVCDTCPGEGIIGAGFRAGIVGTVLDAQSDPPVISVDQSTHVEGLDKAYCRAAQIPTVETPPPTVSAPEATPMPTTPPTVLDAVPVTPPPTIAPLILTPPPTTTMLRTGAPTTGGGGASVVSPPPADDGTVVGNAPAEATETPAALVAPTPSPSYWPTGTYIPTGSAFPTGSAIPTITAYPTVTAYPSLSLEDDGGEELVNVTTSGNMTAVANMTNVTLETNATMVETNMTNVTMTNETMVPNVTMETAEPTDTPTLAPVVPPTAGSAVNEADIEDDEDADPTSAPSFPDTSDSQRYYYSRGVGMMGGMLLLLLL